MSNYYDDTQAQNIEDLRKASAAEVSEVVVGRGGQSFDSTEQWIKACEDAGIIVRTNSHGVPVEYLKPVNGNSELTGTPIHEAMFVYPERRETPAGIEFVFRAANTGSTVIGGAIANGYSVLKGDESLREYVDKAVGAFGLDVDKSSAMADDFYRDILINLSYDKDVIDTLWADKDGFLMGANYFRGDNWIPIYDYLKENGLLQYKQEVKDYSYDTDHNKISIHASGDLSGMYNAIDLWTKHTNLSTVRSLPSGSALSNAIETMKQYITNKYQTDYNIAPNCWRVLISNWKNDLSYFDILMAAIYIPNNGEVNFNGNWNDLTSNPITNYDNYRTVGGGWRFGRVSGVDYWETGTWTGYSTPFLFSPQNAHGLLTLSNDNMISYSWGNMNVSNTIVNEEIPAGQPFTRKAVGHGNVFMLMNEDGSYPEWGYGGGAVMGYDEGTSVHPIRVDESIPDIEVPLIDPVTGDTYKSTYIYINVGGDPKDRDPIVKYYEPDPTENDIGNNTLPPDQIVSESRGLYRIYNPTAEHIKEFGEWLWSQNVLEILKTIFQSPLDGILGLHLLYVKPKVSATLVPINVGYLTAKVGSTTADIMTVPVTSQFQSLDCGSVSIAELYGDARDYPPHAEIEIYLPFIGYRALDPYAVIGGTIRVYYNIDVLTGICVAFIEVTRDGTTKIIATFDGNCSIPIPLTSADRSAIAKGAVNGIVSSGINLAMGNVAGAAIGAINGAIGAATAGVSIDKSGSISGNAGALSNKKPYIIIKRFRPYEATGYNEVIGHTDNRYNRVGDNDGYCQFTNIKLECDALGEEYDEILNLLTTGVFL